VNESIRSCEVISVAIHNAIGILMMNGDVKSQILRSMMLPLDQIRLYVV